MKEHGTRALVQQTCRGVSVGLKIGTCPSPSNTSRPRLSRLACARQGRWPVEHFKLLCVRSASGRLIQRRRAFSSSSAGSKISLALLGGVYGGFSACAQCVTFAEHNMLCAPPSPGVQEHGLGSTRKYAPCFEQGAPSPPPAPLPRSSWTCCRVWARCAHTPSRFKLASRVHWCKMAVLEKGTGVKNWKQQHACQAVRLCVCRPLPRPWPSGVQGSTVPRK